MIPKNYHKAYEFMEKKHTYIHRAIFGTILSVNRTYMCHRLTVGQGHTE